MTVDTQEGVDVQFSSSDMTLSIKQFSEKYLKSAMIQLANSVDLKLMGLYNKVWNWVGTPGQTVDSFADFAKGPQRLDEMAVPTAGRNGVLSPADNWGLLGNFSGLFTSDIAKSALTKAKLPMVGGVDLYAAQNIKTHTVGTKAGTPLVNGASQTSTYLRDQEHQHAEPRHRRLDGLLGHPEGRRRVHHRGRLRSQPGVKGGAVLPAAVRGAGGRVVGRRRQCDGVDRAGHHHVGRLPDRVGRTRRQRRDHRARQRPRQAIRRT